MLNNITFAGGFEFHAIEWGKRVWVSADDACHTFEIDNADGMADISPEETATFTSGADRITVNLISESALYSLMLTSDKPKAKPFRKWVTSEVLPSISKNGIYFAPSIAALAVESPANFTAKVLSIGLTNNLTAVTGSEDQAFEEWVTSEVLPSIRKMGGYVTPEMAAAASKPFPE